MTLTRWSSAMLARAVSVAALHALPVTGATVQAAELKVLSGMGMRAILTSVAGEFERRSGHTLTIVYDTAGLVRDRVRAGERVDVAIMQRTLLDDLLAQGKVERVSAADLARSQIGLAARAGAQKPDIGSADALKDTLLKAQSIAYTDPANGGLSGSQFAKVLDRLGIAEQMKGKTKLGQPMARVVSGEVEFAVLQISEILPLKGVQLVGPLPEEFQDKTAVAAAIVAGAREAEAGAAFIAFLSSADAAGAIQANGMKPIGKR